MSTFSHVRHNTLICCYAHIKSELTEILYAFDNYWPVISMRYSKRRAIKRIFKCWPDRIKVGSAHLNRSNPSNFHSILWFYLCNVALF